MTAVEAGVSLVELARNAQRERDEENVREQANRRTAAVERARRNLTWAFKRMLNIELAEGDERIEVTVTDDLWSPSARAFITLDGIRFSSRTREFGEYRDEVLEVVRPCEECGDDVSNELSHGGIAALGDLLDAPGLHVHGCPKEEEEETAPTARPLPIPTPLDERVANVLRELVRDELAAREEI